jgi:DNA polymerase-1
MASSFGRPLLAKINPATGRLHCNLKISGAKSGRFSCANPNLQQVPARGEQGAFMRSIFIAPPRRILIGADYSQLELRVLAAVSGDAAMNAAFSNGQDLHAVTACGMLHIRPEDFDKDNPAHKAARASARAVNCLRLWRKRPRSVRQGCVWHLDDANGSGDHAIPQHL